jgi:hypothetical protein
MKTKTRLLRSTAILLSLAIVQLSFGPEAWSAVVSVAGMSAPVGEGAAAAAGSIAGAGAPMIAAPATLVPSALTGAPVFSAPSASLSAAPSAAPSAARAAAPVEAARALSAPSARAAASAPEDETPASAASAPKSPAAAPAAAPAEASAVVRTGPRTAGAAARATTRFRELIRFFSGRRDAALPAAGETPAALNGAEPESGEPARLQPSPKSGETAPLAAAEGAVPAPETPQAAPASNKRSIKWFLGGMIVGQVGVEILGLAMPLLMRAKFGGFSALAHIAVVSSAAGIVGRLSGGWISNKIGVKATFIGATAIRLLSITGMVVFLMGPTAPLVAAVPPFAWLATILSHYSAELVLTAFYSFNSLVAGVALTAQQSIPTILLGNDRATMERFYSLQQWTLEIVGVTGPKAGGVLVQMFGFTTAIAVYPVMLTIAVVMYMLGIRMPGEGKAAAEGAPSKAASTLSRILAPMAPMNRAIAGTVKRVMGRVTGFVDGLVLKAYLGRWIEALGGQGKLTDADEQTLLSRSTLGWMGAAALSLAGFATLLLPTVIPAYGAMVVFGVCEVIAAQKLYSLILSRTKGKAETVKINAIAGASFAAAYTVALNLAGMLFDKTAGLTPFLVFNAALIPVAVGVYFLRRALKKHDEAGSPEPAVRPTSGFKLLFKDPMMRWAFLGYVLLGMTNPLLYQILSQAFGLMIVGGSATAASGVASWITALYSFGGLLGALYMWRESTLISAAKGPAKAPAETK